MTVRGRALARRTRHQLEHADARNARTAMRAHTFGIDADKFVEHVADGGNVNPATVGDNLPDFVEVGYPLNVFHFHVSY